MVHFVGAGSGAADLITVRGARLLSEADVIIWAGSLVNPELLNYAKPGCEIHNSAKLTLEQVIYSFGATINVYVLLPVTRAAALQLESGLHPGQLKDAVCSPGGSTIQGVRALEAGGFRAAAFEAVVAAYEKTLEMAKQ